MNSNGRLRYMRFMVTNSGISCMHGPHQVAHRFTSSSLPESVGAALAAEAFFASFSTLARSIVSRVTGSASHFLSDSPTVDCLSAHLVEQPKTFVVSTGTGFPANSASMASRASCEVTSWISELSIRP